MLHYEQNNELNISKLTVTEVSKSFNHSYDYTKNESEQQLEQLIANLLKYGVFTAFSTVLIGGVMYLTQFGLEPADYRFFEGQPSVFDAPMLVLDSILSGSSYSIMIFGLLLLIAIPVVRVAISLFTFFKQGDFTYTVMTLLALSGLIYSFITAYA